MDSFSTSFIVGSASSATSGVRDALQSYRRAQYLVAGSTVASNSESEDLEDDEEAPVQARRPFHEIGEQVEEYDSDAEEGVVGSARSRDDSFIGQLDWDEDYTDSPRRFMQREDTARPGDRFLQVPTLTPQGSAGRQAVVGSPLSPPSSLPAKGLGEETPLLAKKASRVSFSTPLHRAQDGPFVPKDSATSLTAGLGTTYHATASPLTRRLSTASLASSKGVRFHFGGHSTFGQTLFNSIAILLGIGMLSEPLAFAYSGWLVGTLLIVSYGFVACYTAKILARIILSDPRIRSYSDIGRKAFGPKVTPFISFMFCLELFAVSVVLVTLYSDSLHSLLPQHSADVYKIWGIFILVPTVFLPLSLLSYTSILGIISTISMIIVIFIDGFSKPDAPGSFWSPAETDFGVKSYTRLGVAFGLFMAGFSGHAVIPSLARDMVDPSRFDEMINWAFVVATFIYTIIGYAGYLMFGNFVRDEISVDLLATPGYNPLLNTICLWLLVISPLSKFALNTQPLNATIEILLGIDKPMLAPEDLAAKPDGLSVAPKGAHFGRWKRVLGVLQRIFLTSMAVMVSILIPEFSSMMAFLGSFSAFMLSIVGPVLAKVMIEGRCGKFDALIITVGIVMAVWGTAAAFL